MLRSKWWIFAACVRHIQPIRFHCFVLVQRKGHVLREIISVVVASDANRHIATNVPKVTPLTRPFWFHALCALTIASKCWFQWLLTKMFQFCQKRSSIDALCLWCCSPETMPELLRSAVSLHGTWHVIEPACVCEFVTSSLLKRWWHYVVSPRNRRLVSKSSWFRLWYVW